MLRLTAVHAAHAARARGARLLVDAALTSRFDASELDWVHPHAGWLVAELLDRGGVEAPPASIAPSAVVHPTAIVYPSVVIAARAEIGPYAVVGGPGFGWVHGPSGRARAMPHPAGVVIDEDVFIGAHSTIHAGVLAPTLIGARTKLDAHVHIAHNCEIGPDCFLAAQTGLAGSVVLGRGVLAGGQSGFADHVHVGDGARIAAKSGVIGDVPAGATYGGYPAVPRLRWLRGVAAAQRGRA